MITSDEREFAINQLDQSRDRMLSLVQGLAADQLSYKPGTGRWSMAENLEHVLVVERRLVRAIEKMAQTPGDTSKHSAITDGDVIGLVGTVREPIQAPENALPKMRWPVGELIEQFAAIRQQTRDFLATTDGDLRHHFITHQVFGEMDCYQWLLLIGAHSNRHRAQCEGLRASTGFPS